MGTPLGVALFLLAAPARAGCDPIDPALAAAERSFGAGDGKALARALADVEDALACVRDPVPPATCARVHRALALEASLAGDAEAVAEALRAMLHADPLAALPSPLVPDRHPLRAALVQAEERTTTFVEGPGKGWLVVDGIRTGAVPVGQPYVLQRTKPGDRTLGARLVRP